MQIVIDTSNRDLFIGLIKDGQVIEYKLIENLVKKADKLPSLFKELLGDIKTSDIKEFYITIGPGSFTGARIGMAFSRSICQITKAKMFVTSSIQFIAGPFNNAKIFIDARSNMSYYGEVEKGKLLKPISLIEFNNSTEMNYNKFLEHPNEYLAIFEEVKDILTIKPIYVKDPKIS